VQRGGTGRAHQVASRFPVESGSSNTFPQNELAVEVKMTDKLPLSVAYAVRHDTDVPAGVEKTDQLTTANIVFAF
jgi:putative salt-induced outer membrane protein